MRSSTALVLCAVIALFLTANPAAAQVGNPNLVNISDVAGATLLGPYFEVDLSNPTGMNTIFSVDNIGANTTSVFGNPPQTFTNFNGATAVLAHVTVWTNLGVPVLTFNIYLTGWDVQIIDMRKVLNGTLPQTASAGQDPNDTISPKGRESQDINFASCAGQLPPVPLSASAVADLQNALTGKAVAGQGGKCGGASLADNVARGYITIDTVNNCTLRFPSDTGYIGPGGFGDVTDQTQLTGEVFYVDQLHGVTRGTNMVAIHASPSDPNTTTAGNYTFYGRYDGFNANDNRQGLPTTFGARFVNGNFTLAAATTPTSPAWGLPPATPPPGTTNLVVWRDAKTSTQPFFTCGGALPAPYPLPDEGVVAFDEQEHPQMTGLNVNTFGLPFPLATQSVRVGSAQFPVTFTSGWIYADLNHAATPGPASDPAQAQGWVEVIETGPTGITSLMRHAFAIDSYLKANHFIPSS